jgi:lysophospholipase L1-like esterase
VILSKDRARAGEDAAVDAFQRNSLRLAVLGDSIAFGQGAARPADRLAARLVADLTASGIPTRSRVYAVPGARSDGLAAQVRRAAAEPPDVALIVIGANDLTALVPPDSAARLLGAAVTALRGVGAEVVVAPAPDLSAVPGMPTAIRALVQAGSAALRTAQTRAALAAGARVADEAASTSVQFARDPGLFSADRFHPSSAGYAVIAAALAPVLREASRDALRRAG